MKILIIAHSRSGSQNLMESLREILDCPQACEPWNRSLKRGECPEVDLGLSRLVVKTLSNQVPAQEDPVEFYREYAKNFDTLILLARRDKKSAFESYTHCLESGKWHVKWEWKEGAEINAKAVQGIKHSQDIIDELSKEMQIPITWYEDLYSGDRQQFSEVVNTWGLDCDELFPYFDPKDRLRG